jgi:predicted transcriptional regulator
MRKATRFYDEWRLEDKRRYMLVNFLRKNNIPKYQIAKILGITVLRVNRILLGIREYEKEKGESFPSSK